MKLGSLVRCNFQPSSRGYDTSNGCMKPMPHHIKGEFGIITGRRDELSVIVYFPKFSYEHTLAHRALEVINESR
jgi:hypothetical protein